MISIYYFLLELFHFSEILLVWVKLTSLNRHRVVILLGRVELPLLDRHLLLILLVWIKLLLNGHWIIFLLILDRTICFTKLRLFLAEIGFKFLGIHIYFFFETFGS